jgi:hypothetical protein
VNLSQQSERKIVCDEFHRTRPARSNGRYIFPLLYFSFFDVQLLERVSTDASFLSLPGHRSRWVWRARDTYPGRNLDILCSRGLWSKTSVSQDLTAEK